MADAFEIEVGPDSSKEDLERAKLLADIQEVQARTRDILGKQAFEASQQYHNRVIHFNDIVEYRSCAKAITQLSELARQSTEPVEILFHSPGGDIFSGWGLFDYMQLLRSSGIWVTTVVLGGAFSMAGILLQGGDWRVMTPHSWLMIHEAGMTNLTGTTAGLKDDVDLLKRIEMQGNEILAERSGLPVSEIEAKTNRRNWWMSSDEALEKGFIDEIRPVSAPPTNIKTARKRRVRKVAA